MVLITVALALSACGARLSPQVLRQATDAALSQRGHSTGGTRIGQGATGNPGGTSQGVASSGAASSGAASSGSSGGSATPAAAGSGSAQASGNSAGATGTPGAGTSSTGAGATTPAAGNGGATDVGVTANSITVGNVSDLSGPVPGIFEGADIGTQAYFNYINSQGGVYGRQLKLDAADSQTNCSQNENATQQLVGKVFAFVGSFSLYDNCGAQVLAQHTNVPDLSYALSSQAEQLPNNFSVAPLQPGGYATGMFSYYAHTLGSAVRHVGTIYPNIPSASASALAFNSAAQSVGWKIVYQDSVPATDTNFTADIVRMEAAGVKIFFTGALTAQDAATVVQEESQQNWHPINIIPIAYAQNFVALVGSASAADGVMGWNEYSLFFNHSDAQHIPEAALYQTWMQRTNPRQPEDLYSMYAWAEAALFVQALKAAGPRATRAGLLAQLHKITSFDANGLVAPANPGAKTPPVCYVLWQVQNGHFVRVNTPAAGYRCDGTFHG
ncbi:MAG: ABC transporter substrate-binding protein [Acidimicrobiales bacterium]